MCLRCSHRWQRDGRALGIVEQNTKNMEPEQHGMRSPSGNSERRGLGINGGALRRTRMDRRRSRHVEAGKLAKRTCKWWNLRDSSVPSVPFYQDLSAQASAARTTSTRSTYYRLSPCSERKGQLLPIVCSSAIRRRGLSLSTMGHGARQPIVQT